MNPTDKNCTHEAQSKLQAPWRAHIYVWFFMLTLSMSPLLYFLGPQGFGPVNRADTLIAIVLIQAALWIAQRRCSSEDLTYWEGLLIVGAAATMKMSPLTLLLAFPVLLLTVAASFLFAVTHDGSNPLRHAQLCYGRLIIAIYRWRRSLLPR
jgi:hypothetical protein